MKDLNASVEHQKRTNYFTPDVNESDTQNTDNKSVSKTVSPGDVVKFNLLIHESNENELYTLKLVNYSKSCENEISLESPIGEKINNMHVGEVKTYAFRSNNFTITILDIITP